MHALRAICNIAHRHLPPICNDARGCAAHGYIAGYITSHQMQTDAHQIWGEPKPQFEGPKTSTIYVVYSWIAKFAWETPQNEENLFRVGALSPYRFSSHQIWVWRVPSDANFAGPITISCRPYARIFTCYLGRRLNLSLLYGWLSPKNRLLGACAEKSTPNKHFQPLRITDY